MLHYLNFTTPTKAAPTRDRRRSLSGWATVIATFVALSLLSNPSFGQDTEVVDPPTPTVEADQKKVTPTEGANEDADKGSDNDADKTKTPEAPVVLKKIAVDFGGKELNFEAPESWKAKEPRFKNITKHELMLPKAEGEEKDARMTFSISSGSMQGNIDRWKTQFKFPNGAAPDKVFAMEKKAVDGYELTFVQIRGTFMETMRGGGPFAGGKKTPRENYMMKAVIISTPGAEATTPKCFIKLVGSEKAMKRQAKAYSAMVKSMKAQASVE